MPAVLGIDSSTQACKVEVRDADTGQLLGRARAEHPTTNPPRSEQDPDAWWAALRGAVQHVDVRGVGAVAVAGQQHGLVALDQHARPLRPAKLWNDTESAPDADWLREQLGGPAAWAEACGSVPVASFTITKLSWLHRTEPDTWKHLRHVLLPHDYLNTRLTGRCFTDRGDASGTGYWSPSDGDYRSDLLAIVDPDIDWEQIVPPVVASTAFADTLQGSAAEELGMPMSTPVGPGTGDNMAAALGIGLQPGDVAISIGTSGTVFSVAEHPTADASGAVAGFADATGRFLPLVCTLNAARVTDTIGRLLGVDPAQLDTLALDAPPGAAPTLVPYFAGERTPNRPNATGSIVGLRGDVTREQLALAAFQGVVCGLLEGLDALAEAGVDVDQGRLFLVGGGARSAAYRHVLADLAQRDVHVTDAQELVATGACVQAAACLNGEDPIELTASWGLGRASLVAPNDATDHEAIRAAYAAARG